jgi:transposase IS116/IS110/IS902 family protein
VEEDFGRLPDAEIYRSQPGMGAILGARVLAELGDDPHRYADGKGRRNYAGTSPVTRAPGKKKAVAARFVRNGRLADALHTQAFASLNASPGARAFYDALRARGIEHNDALRRLANRLTGTLHGCLKTRTLYDEATAWSHRENLPHSSAAAAIPWKRGHFPLADSCNSGSSSDYRTPVHLRFLSFACAPGTVSLDAPRPGAGQARAYPCFRTEGPQRSPGSGPAPQGPPPAGGAQQP